MFLSQKDERHTVEVQGPVADRKNMADVKAPAGTRMMGTTIRDQGPNF
jgi:hypothetical protein